MRIIRQCHNLDDDARGAVVAVGNFDGVHLGHRKVIAEAATIAREHGTKLGVITFEPHPRSFFENSGQAFRLTPFRAKIEAIESLGVDILYVLRFNKNLANLSADSFISNILVNDLKVRHIVIGYDFAFGFQREGDIKFLRKKALLGNYKVTSVDKAQDENGPFSASAARRYIEAGDVQSAEAILGRPWQVLGRIKYGDQIGRTLGFPTANLSVVRILRPKPGIYAVWAALKTEGIQKEKKLEWRPAAAYVGRRPTFDKSEELLEVHLLDFNCTIYGQLLRVAFISHIRDDEKFENLDDLRKQMYLDCQRARAILANLSPPSNKLYINTTLKNNK